jgi:hypothetical protein
MKDDFRVVCANCHRMIYRKGTPGTLNDFLQLYANQQALRQGATEEVPGKQPYGFRYRR